MASIIKSWLVFNTACCSYCKLWIRRGMFSMDESLPRRPQSDRYTRAGCAFSFSFPHKPCCIYFLLKIKTFYALDVLSVLPLCIKNGVKYTRKSSVMTTTCHSLFTTDQDCCREKSLHQLSIERQWLANCFENFRDFSSLFGLVSLKTQLEEVICKD